MANDAPFMEARGVSKYFGHVVALEDISMQVGAGQVTCLLGDNGAGKSTLIKIFSGVHQPDKGTMALDGEEVLFNSPRNAIDRGIATVYQDLAMIPLMGISRNFFIGREPTKGAGPFNPRGAGQDRHQPSRHHPACLHSLGRREAVGGHRSRRVLRG